MARSVGDLIKHLWSRGDSRLTFLRRRLLIIIPVVAVIAMALLAGVFALNRRIDRQRVYKIGYGDNPPLHFQDETGNPAGLAVGIVKEAARRQGIRLQWIPTKIMGLDAIRTGVVDLWVMMTDLPERHRKVYFTQPYLLTEYCFLVRADSPFHRPPDLGHAHIASAGFGIHRKLLGELVPNARMSYIEGPQAAIEAVSEGTVDAAFFEQSVAAAAILNRHSAQNLRILAAPVPPGYLALASAFRFSGVADQLREEMRRMTRDGSLSPLIAGGGFFPSLNLEAIETLLNARDRERSLIAGLVSLMILLGFTTFLVVASRRQKVKLQATESSLNESEKYYRTLVDLLPDTMYIVAAGNPSHPIIPPSHQREQMDVLVRDLVAGQGHQEKVAAVIATGHPAIAEEETAGRALEYRLVPLPDENGAIGAVMGVLRDQTAQRKAEAERAQLEEQLRQSQRLETVGHLAGGVAHDFNNLLTVIIGYSQTIIRKAEKDSPLKDPAEAISRAALKAAALTRQLLTFSRRYEEDLKVISLNSVVVELKEMLQPLIGARVKSTFSLCPEQCLILADRGQIEQDVMNLVLNARDAMPRGGHLFIETANISVSDDFAATSLAVPRGRYVTLSVADTGTGMTPEVQSHIFEPFFTTKPPGKGTGLGLSTIYGIVKQCGGSIRVHSSPDIGTSFRVFLPAVEAALSPEPPAPAEALWAGTETILLVEDEFEVRRLMRDILDQHGYRTLDVGSGADAIDLARHYKGKIHLLLTDMVLAEMNGLEIMREIRTILPEIQILRMSGYAERIGRRIDSTTRFLQKPFTAEKLLTQVRAALDSEAVT